MNKKIKYMREGKGPCAKCARELDVVVPVVPRMIGPSGANITGRWTEQALDMVVSRHLNRIDEYGPRGALPGGFCPGSLGPIGERVRDPRAKRKR